MISNNREKNVGWMALLTDAQGWEKVLVATGLDSIVWIVCI